MSHNEDRLNLTYPRDKKSKTLENLLLSRALFAVEYLNFSFEVDTNGRKHNA